LVTYARQHGIKAAARAFESTVPSVRNWLRRYQAQGLPDLQELSRAPHFCPHKITGELAEQGVACGASFSPSALSASDASWI